MKLRRVVTLALLALLLSPLQAVPLTSATIADLQSAFAAGTLTSEKLTTLYVARIAAYDKQGPTINAVITLNPRALETARALDAERRAGKVRGPLHGIPIVLKDNIDTFDLPTTGGSQLLEGSIPPDDAFIARKLREAGAVIIAKVNLSEWAGSGGSVSGATDPAVIAAGRVPNGFSSAGGQTLNPHDLKRGPSGSSGGTGAAIAAAFAQVGLGTDTGGSIRGPSSANGLAGLKPTRGLLSRDGIIPLALSYDTAGPMARNIYDVAVSLGVMTGVDSADEATAASEGKFRQDYTTFLKRGSLKGARLGLARDFMGQDTETDRLIEASVTKLRELGATVTDIRFPEYLLGARQGTYTLLVASEFKAQLTEYLKTTKPGYPKSFDEVVTRSNDLATKYRSPGKAFALTYTAKLALELNDPVYLANKHEQLASVKATVLALFKKHQLDAIIYPTSPRPASLIETPAGAPPPTSTSPSSIANFTGFPDLIVPVAVTKDNLPVTLSFLGEAWSEPKLLGYGYDFEQAVRGTVLPKTTPPLPGEDLR